MTERVLGPTGSPRRRWSLLLPIVAAIALGLFYITGAQAVHDYSNGMQLDGNVANNCPPAPDTGVCVNTQADWADFFDVSSGGGTTTPKATLPNTSFKKALFIRDFESATSRNGACSLTSDGTTFCTGDSSTFATGSKDELDIANGGWQCNRDNNVNSKIDIMNAYTASYTASNGDKIMYFGLEKNKDNGVNDVGFWFLQGSASCTAPANGATNWTGSNHTVGDVLVVSEFSNGGGVSNITAYKWVGGSNPLLQIANATGAQGDCKTNLGLDNICATTNSGSKQFNTTLATPWLTSDATLGIGKTQIVPPDFFEGGINLTEAFKDTPGGGTAPSCFNTFVGDTRSSKETSATLFDYATGQLGECKTTLTTQQNSGGPLSIGTGIVQSGTDTATLTITGTTNWGGTLTWYLCGPGATACDSHGVKVTERTVSNQSPASDFISGQAYLTSAGAYCWHAHFEPNDATKAAGVTAGDDDGTNECFTVNPVTPTLTTSASCSASPCVIGSTLSDKAFLTGTATMPGTGGPGGDQGAFKSIYLTSPSGLTKADGTITWTLFGPASDGTAQCVTTKTLSPNTATVNGDNTTTGYGPVTFVSDATGKFTFAASYDGDSPNTNGDSEPCSAAGQNNANGEQVTVTGSATSSSAQRWLPNDRVVLGSTAGTILKGSLTVKLYRGTFTVTNGVCAPDATATAISGQSYTASVDQTNAATKNAFTYNTTNSTFFVGTKDDGTAGGADGTYFWLVQFAATGLDSPADRCEKTVITITD
jgi:hypothetical protein